MPAGKSGRKSFQCVPAALHLCCQCLWLHNWCVPSLSPRPRLCWLSLHRQFQIFLVLKNWPWCVFFLCCYQRFAANLSEKAIKRRWLTAMITMITVNNRMKQDRVTVIMVICSSRKGTICFASSFCCPPDSFFFFFNFPSGSWCTASWVQHMHYNTMLSVALAPVQTAPVSFREAGCCLLVSLSWAGTVCTCVFLNLWGYKGQHTGED